MSECTVNLKSGHVNIQTNCRQLLGRIVLDPNLSAVIEYIL